VCDLLSSFAKAFTVRALIINASVEFSIFSDIVDFMETAQYPREYVIAVNLRAFEEMLHFKHGDPTIESTKPFIESKVENKPESLETLTWRLQP
jgi:hypothetical protein